MLLGELAISLFAWMAMLRLSTWSKTAQRRFTQTTTTTSQVLLKFSSQ
jgi:hypothetical protein